MGLSWVERVLSRAAYFSLSFLMKIIKVVTFFLIFGFFALPAIFI